MRILLILLLATAAPVSAQTFSVIAANHADSVVLRWAPSSALAWERYRTTGYRVERITIANKEVSQPRRIGPQQILPWTLEEFKTRFPRTHPNAPAAAQVLYGAVASEQRSGIEPVDTELDLRWSIAIFLADVDAGVAKAMGLRFADKDVEPNVIYYYRVITLSEPTDTAFVVVDRTLGNYSLAEGPVLQVKEEERRVLLKWDADMYSNFTAYWIERSDEGRTWSRLNRTPFVPMRDALLANTTEHSYSDTSIAANYKPYHYRVLGIDPFGSISVEAPVIVAMGRDRTAPASPEMKGVAEEKGRMVVRWDQPAVPGDMRGFRVEKALSSSTGFYPLHRDLLPNNTRQFTDTSTMLLAGNYYRVAAMDTAGNIAYSLGGYGSVTDSIAPLPPTDLEGNIDTNGVVTLRWKQGKEPDLLGYRVFFANQADHDFNNLTPAPIESLVFMDTIPLRTLTKRIHYKVVAVDRNFNHSGLSAMLTLFKPDVVAPVAPLFKHYAATDSSVILDFVPSSSDDVAAHVVLRKDPGAPAFNEVARFAGPWPQRTWTDVHVSGPATYQYSLVAIDSTGNRSPDTQAIEVTVRGTRKHAAPTSVTATEQQDRSIAVNWNTTSPGLKHCVLYRSRDGAAPTALASPKAGETRFVDTRIPGKGSYMYSLRAVYDDGTTSAESMGVTVNVTR